MQTVPIEPQPGPAGAVVPELPSDEGIVGRVLAGETELFEILVRRYSQRLYRVARRILDNDADAEDAVQQAYLNAFKHLRQFEGRSRFSTWLTQITVYQALAQRRRRHDTAFEWDDEVLVNAASSLIGDPERSVYAVELNTFLKSTLAALPAAYRSVFMLREVHGLSTDETAGRLNLTRGAVKTRLHRARDWIKRTLAAKTSDAASRFDGARCDKLATVVMTRLRKTTGTSDRQSRGTDTETGPSMLVWK